MDTKKIQVVRALWGDCYSFQKEIPIKPLFDDIVIVWGGENNDFLKSLGYKTILVSNENQVSNFTTFEQFILKVDAWKQALEVFDKILFLDWDISIEKEIDEYFWTSFEGKKFLSPLYCYPNGIEFPNLKEDNKEAKGWLDVFANYLYDYSWEFDDLRVLPNAGFVYLNGLDTVNELLKIIEENKIRGLIEEFALYQLANCSLLEYIQNFEPLVVYGRPSEEHFSLGEIHGYVFKKLNEFIESKITKTIYLKHY